MSIAALSTAGFSNYIEASSNLNNVQQAWNSLSQSIASGNLTAAQTAFSTYQKLNTSLNTMSGSSSSGSQFATDWAALGTAISSGNVANAQSALATVSSDLAKTPSQSITNAQNAVAQSVSDIDELLGVTPSSNSTNTASDPTTSILDSAYGVQTNSNSSATGATSTSSANSGTSTGTNFSAIA